MKKLMTLALGLSFLTGTVSLFAQDKPADSTKTEKKAKNIQISRANNPAFLPITNIYYSISSETRLSDLTISIKKKDH